SEASALLHRVTRAANGADDVAVAAAVDGLAQPADMDVDGALVDIDRLAPDIVEQLPAREDAAGVAHHEFEQAEFGRPELYLGCAAVDAMGLAVEDDVADLENRGQHLGLGPPQQGTNPCDEFRRRERLDEIIVGAGSKAPDAVAFL